MIYLFLIKSLALFLSLSFIAQQFGGKTISGVWFYVIFAILFVECEIAALFETETKERKKEMRTNRITFE